MRFIFIFNFLYILGKGPKTPKTNGRFADDSDIFILSKNVKGGEKVELQKYKKRVCYLDAAIIKINKK